MKRCTKCKAMKPAQDFSKDKQKPGGRDLYCRFCRSEIQRRWRDSDRTHYRALAKARRRVDPEKHREYQKAAYKKNPDRWQDYNLRAHYRITLEEFNSMVVAQGGKCAICGQIPDKTLHVDHNHKTGKLRALLCHKHNTGLGLFDENPELLSRAIEYLNQHNEENT